MHAIESRVAGDYGVCRDAEVRRGKERRVAAGGPMNKELKQERKEQNPLTCASDTQTQNDSVSSLSYRNTLSEAATKPANQQQ